MPGRMSFPVQVMALPAVRDNETAGERESRAAANVGKPGTRAHNIRDFAKGRRIFLHGNVWEMLANIFERLQPPCNVHVAG